MPASEIQIPMCLQITLILAANIYVYNWGSDIEYKAVCEINLAGIHRLTEATMEEKLILLSKTLMGYRTTKCRRGL
jgi:hypothetical protein